MDDPGDEPGTREGGAETAPWTPWARDADGQFLIAGIPLSRAVAIAGGTPCYLYDAARVADRVARLKAQLGPGVALHYALKANPMPALVACLARLVDGFDVASGGELGVALDAGMAPRDISFAGPGKSEDDLRRGVAAGILFNVESFREAHLLADIAHETGRRPRVAIRCNLPFALKASGMQMTGRASPFGIDSSAVPAMLRFMGEAPLSFEGLHLFSGSQNLHPDAIIEAERLSFELAMGWLDAMPAPPRWINLGGGFGVPYTPRDRPLDVAPVVANLNALAEQLVARVPGARLVLELGRYLVGEAGLYVARVLDRKISDGEVFLITDGGMHQHLAASGNFGQVIRRNYPIAVNGRSIGGRGSGETEVASVTGPLCTPLDVLARKAELARATAGDLVVVFQSGAYGKTASPRAFLSHPDVREALLWPVPDA